MRDARWSLQGRLQGGDGGDGERRPLEGFWRNKLNGGSLGRGNEGLGVGALRILIG